MNMVMAVESIKDGTLTTRTMDTTMDISMHGMMRTTTRAMERARNEALAQKGKGKRGKSKDKTPPRYQSTGYWKWEPAPKKTVKEVEDILMKECAKFDSREPREDQGTDWLYVQGLDKTLRYTAKIKPRHTRMPVMSISEASQALQLHQEGR